MKEGIVHKEQTGLYEKMEDLLTEINGGIFVASTTEDLGVKQNSLNIAKKAFTQLVSFFPSHQELSQLSKPLIDLDTIEDNEKKLKDLEEREGS